jgi:hypothetical protein
MASDRVEIDIVSKDKTKKGIKQAEQSFKGLQSTVTKLAAAGFGLAAIKSFGEAMLDANVEAQKLNASLVSVTGSQAAASRAFKNLTDFATKTPFQLNQVVQAFIKMKSLGLDATEESLTSFGNTASAMGKDLNQMIEAVADASTGEFERLKEFGIKSKSEGDNVSFTFQGVTTTVRKNAEEITGYLKTIGDEKFGDAMSEQMKTLGGSISNAEDAWGKFLRALGESGIADATAAALGVVTVALNQFAEAIDPTVAGRIQDIRNELNLLYDQQAGAGDSSSIYDEAIARAEAELAALTKQREEEKVLAAEEATVKKTPEQIELKKKEDEDLEAIKVQKQQDKELDILIASLENQEAIREVERQQLQTQNDYKVQLYEEDVAASERASKRKADKEKAASDAGMQALADLGSLMNSESKKAFEIGKIAAIASTTIDTYQSATSSFKALSGIPVVGPALGAAAAAAAIAAGLANVQAISSQQFQGGGGGTPAVPNISASTVGPTGPVGQPQGAAQPTFGDNIEVRTGSVLGVLIEEEIIPAMVEAQKRGVQLVIT